MYNLLIVDDEPRIVNGLYEQFLDWKQEELSVYRALSAVEAMRILSVTKIDIVLSDIHMPGMNGIELQKQILRLWPRCKVIFLSGFSDFEYVQSALRDGGLDYILKLEGDDQIFAAVGKAIGRLREERMSEQLLQKAKQQYEAAIPMLQKDFLISLLQGELSGCSVRQDRLDELRIPLSAQQSVLLSICRVDRWPENIRPTDRSLLMYAIGNIASEYFSQVTVVSCSMSASHLAILVQPAENGSDGKSDADWGTCLSFVHGTSSDIQDTCKTMLKLPVSIALSGVPCAWTSAAVQYLRLEQLLHNGFGHGHEMLLSDRNLREATDPSSVPAKQYLALRLKAVNQLEPLLMGGRSKEFFVLFDEIEKTARMLQNEPSMRLFLIQLEYSLASLFVSYLNQWGLLETFSSTIDLGPLLHHTEFPSWIEAFAYYRKLSELLFAHRTDEQIDRTEKMLASLNHYIEQHLAEDLSLEKLADRVYLHPTYLSRLYKQISGIRLSDYIKEARLKKAAELLAIPTLKIQEVATRVGFESAHYFAKVFKKNMHMTPQEYRSSCLNGND
ncbi:two-component system response regulator YesN [Paenibacillus rhizosphaerae]|uniref:Two-component system response regulator YesN n=1 Tax=Paenibacillus rhizosphaerae TaxID=297318 RepID=A0A839TN46_9BACL|nr:response regulator [Paenibacillus rhizosphaerae]MBB3128226.1 two-component system response regulator YesN [Paenibacillus rhizosphaerae]